MHAQTHSHTSTRTRKHAGTQCTNNQRAPPPACSSAHSNIEKSSQLLPWLGRRCVTQANRNNAAFNCRRLDGRIGDNRLERNAWSGVHARSRLEVGYRRPLASWRAVGEGFGLHTPLGKLVSAKPGPNRFVRTTGDKMACPGYTGRRACLYCQKVLKPSPT